MADPQPPINDSWVKRSIRLCKYLKTVFFFLSFGSAVAFSVFLTKHLHDPNSNSLFFSDLYNNISFSTLLVVFLYVVIGTVILLFNGRFFWLPKPTFVTDLQRRHFFYRLFYDVLLISLQVIADISCPLISAYLGSRVEEEEIHLVAWFTLGLFFLCASISSLREYGAIDGSVAIILGLLYSKQEAPRFLAKCLGLNYDKNKKVLLIIFAALIPALRRALVPGCKALDKWARSDDTFTTFMKNKYPKPLSADALPADVEMGLLDRPYASDSRLDKRRVATPHAD